MSLRKPVIIATATVFVVTIATVIWLNSEHTKNMKVAFKHQTTTSSVPRDPSAITAQGPEITYQVSGAKAQVAYGPDAAEDGESPMKETRRMKGYDNFSLIARISSEGGKVNLSVWIDGKLLKRTSGSGPEKIVMITVYKDAVTNDWIGVPSRS
jgi:hypothetical protein